MVAGKMKKCIILKCDFKLEDTAMFIDRELEKAFLDANDFFSVLLLTGARQVGKTTFLRRMATPERRFVSLDPLDVRRKAESDPRLFLADNPPPVIIDEIQHVPSLLPI